MQGSLCCDRGAAGALCWFTIVIAARGRLVGGYAVARIGVAGYALVVYGCVVVMLSPALRVASFVALASCAPPDGRFVLQLSVLGRWWSVAVVWWCTDPLPVGCAASVCGPPHGGAWCRGVWPPSWWGVLWWCVPPLLVGCGVGSPSWWGAAWRCVAPCLVGRAALVCGPPHGGARCGGVWPPSWWGVLRGCVAPLMVERGVVLCGPPHGGAWCGGVWSPAWWGVLWWRVTPCWWGVVLWCVAPLMMGRSSLVCGPPHGGACCVGVCPPSWRGCVVLCCVALGCGVLSGFVLRCVVWWWCVAPLMVGRAALVCGPPHGGACCVGVRCAVLCRVVCCDGVLPPSWWGCVLLCCVASRCGVLCCVALRCVPKALLPKGKRPGCLPTGKGKQAGLCVLCARRA